MRVLRLEKSRQRWRVSLDLTTWDRERAVAVGGGGGGGGGGGLPGQQPVKHAALTPAPCHPANPFSLNSYRM
ncbi:hypothetical protein E2C01_008683 [Portunus trituberculatus]|uniref:Uncharacterized protein n=1 Tax=Portunus trituberculatus TaxID=210409 RepID=A0A5B7D2L9_PORTR|nr:hypothetical protein [Portunus trituberculatus]